MVIQYIYLSGYPRRGQIKQPASGYNVSNCAEWNRTAWNGTEQRGLLSKSHQRGSKPLTLRLYHTELTPGRSNARTPECLSTRCARYANHCESFKFCINSTSFIMIFMITDRINTYIHTYKLTPKPNTYTHISIWDACVHMCSECVVAVMDLPMSILLCSCHKDIELWLCARLDDRMIPHMRAENDPVIIADTMKCALQSFCYCCPT